MVCGEHEEREGARVVDEVVFEGFWRWTGGGAG